MWVSTKKTFNNDPIFFQFCRNGDLCIFNYTNMKQLFSKEIHEHSFATIYSVRNYGCINLWNYFQKFAIEKKTEKLHN